jgi:hypothetical protein
VFSEPSGFLLPFLAAFTLGWVNPSDAGGFGGFVTSVSFFFQES